MSVLIFSYVFDSFGYFHVFAPLSQVCPFSIYFLATARFNSTSSLHHLVFSLPLKKKSEHIFNFILQWCCRPSLLPVTAPLLLCDRLCCWRRRRHRRRQRRRRTQHNYHNFAYSASSEKLVTPPCPLSQCMAHNYEPAEQQQHTATTVATVRSATIRS